jgi:hypothetical protein
MTQVALERDPHQMVTVSSSYVVVSVGIRQLQLQLAVLFLVFYPVYLSPDREGVVGGREVAFAAPNIVARGERTSG